MKYSILGFNQSKCVKLNLTIKDILILQYIREALASPSMQHITDDNDIAYVWLLHDKVLEDLPILDINTRSLIGYLNKLKDMGLISVLSLHDKKGRGTKSYYTITSKCEELVYDQVQKIAVENARPSAKNCTSDNILNKNIDNTDITNVISSAEPNNVDDFFKTQSLIEKPKKRKSTLYANCMSLIDDFTQDEEVRNLLKDYFKVRLERKDIPLGKASFQGSLNKLRTLTTSKKEVLQIIQQSIDRCYPSFYPLSKPRYTKEYTCPEIISKGEKREITQEEYEEAMLNGEKF